MDIVFVGNKHECTGFSLSGIKTVKVEDKKEFIEKIDKLLTEKNIGVIVISDRFFNIFERVFSEKIKKRAIPSVIFVPSIDGIHMERSLKEFIKNVLGIGF